VEFEQMNGAEKAAVVILSMPPASARDLLAQLGDDEVGGIMTAIAGMPEVPTEIQQQVLKQFEIALDSEPAVVPGGRDRALELIHETLDEHRAEVVRGLLVREERRIDWTLRGFEPNFIAGLLRDEHPQAIALILSQIPASRGAAVIAALDDPGAVVRRLAALEPVSPEVMGELEEAVAEMFGKRLDTARRIGGCDVAAQLLNRIGKESAQKILDTVGRTDERLAREIRKRMLTFNDLLGVEDRGFQLLLREIRTEDLVVALKAASSEMREKVFRNTSSRAAEQIREDLEMLGPMRLAEVEAVQQRIIEIARGLAAAEKIRLPVGEPSDVFV
jgi:flagellar motor switch protein FliG